MDRVTESRSPVVGRHYPGTMGTGQDEEAADDGDAEASLETGIRDQRLNIAGWFASHADTGTRGPHVHLGTNDGRNPVLSTRQIPELIAALTLVAERIDRLWEKDSAEYPFGDEPDDNDPAVIRQRRIADLELHDRVAANLPEVLALITQAESSADAMGPVGALLGVDDVEALARLSRFSLWSLTRGGQAARTRKLAELRQQP